MRQHCFYEGCHPVRGRLASSAENGELGGDSVLGVMSRFDVDGHASTTSEARGLSGGGREPGPELVGRVDELKVVMEGKGQMVRRAGALGATEWQPLGLGGMFAFGCFCVFSGIALRRGRLIGIAGPCADSGLDGREIAGAATVNPSPRFMLRRGWTG